MRVRAVLVIAAAAITSCYKPPANECVYQCSQATGCPAGLVCSENGFCVEPGSTATCGGGDGDADPDDDAGDPDGGNPDSPPAERRYLKLAVGAHHACAIETTGDLWCWGLNDARQLGVITPDDFAGTPQRVQQPATGGAWVDIAAGAYHTCGLWAPTGGETQLHCWGQNFNYQTGTTIGAQTAPHQVATPADQQWKSLSLGSAHSCAILLDVPRDEAVIKCWGDNSQGQLGTSGGMRATPMDVDVSMVTPATTTWRSLTSGTDHSCAVAANGAAYCWGDNGSGQGGRSGGGTSPIARAVSGGFQWEEVAAGDDFTCGIDASTRTLRCWGRNGSRELGNGGTTSTSTPTGVNDSGATARWKDLSLGLYSSCGIQGPSASTDALGTVRCWGDNDFGQRGDGTFDTPVTGPTSGVLDQAFAVDSGHEFACALGGDPINGGQLHCWGDNADGQIGIGFASDQRRPVRVGESVRGTRTWLAAAAGRRHTCAILSGATIAERELYCWGANMSGQLDASPVPLPRRTPVRMTQGDGATAVVVGSSHTCVRREGGGGTEVVCWGSDQGKQLGVTGNQEPGPVITMGSGHAGVVNAVIGAGNVTCAIGSPAARCWGTPEITTTNYVDQDVPTTLAPGGETPNGSMSVGPSSACWIDGSDVHCTGSNAYGQLGFGQAGDPPSQPATVLGLTDAVRLSVGVGNHRCAINGNRVTVCWGANGYNQVGVADGTDRSAPITVQTPNEFDEVVTGLNHTCGIDGTAILCWGNNDQFQRTAIASSSSLPPTSIVAPVGEAMPGWSQVVSGEHHTCAISTAGVLYCWGASRWGQVGAGAASEASAVRVIDGP